jgi:ribonucleoside-diphosphate reductase alpha chain
MLGTQIDQEISTPSIEEQKSQFQKDISKYRYLSNILVFYPDLFLDMITPATGGIRLDFDQRIFFRAITRFYSTYGVFPRGWGKTWSEVLAMFLVAIRYPDVKLAITAQTLENSVRILKDKYYEIIKQYPLFKGEIFDYHFSKNDGDIVFTSGSTITALANAQSSKGLRKHRIQIEESALLNNEVYQDALEPIPEVPRRTIGKLSVVNPEELNGQINFFSTSGFRNSTEFMRNVDMIHKMARLEGDMVLGSDWQLACWYGRGSGKDKIFKKKEELSPLFFAQNYESRWVLNSPIIPRGVLQNLVNPYLRGVLLTFILNYDIMTKG